ncbi:unnamed protein product [Schistosoma haematobium]|nr:unnamed protein product [Schistosoma haematobium]
MLCCIPNAPATRRIKIDRYSIGNPINFRHIAHMGSSEISDNNVCNSFGLLDQQSLPVHLKLIDLPNLSSNNNTSVSCGPLTPSSLCVSSTVSFTFTTQSPMSTTIASHFFLLFDYKHQIIEELRLFLLVVNQSSHPL